jgi:ankyrin repeat protein
MSCDGKPSRRPFRFDLRHLLLFVAAACAVAAMWSGWTRAQERKRLRERFWYGIETQDKDAYEDAIRKDPSLVHSRLDWQRVSWMNIYDRDVPSLRAAAYYGDAVAVRFLLNHGADVNALDGEGNAAIHWAAADAEPTILQLLLENGARVDIPNEYGDTPLMRAGLSGSRRGAELLISYGAELDLHTACAIGDLEFVARMLKADPAATGSRGSGARTPLACAALANQLAVARYLLEQGADANQPAFEHSEASALHCASEHPEMTQLLIDHDAKVDLALFGWQTPLQYALSGKHWKTVNALVAAGADVNPKDCDPTPLYLAAEAGAVETVRLMLSHGAAVNVACERSGYPQQKTPLQIALRNGHVDIVEVLQAAGAE